MKSQENLKNYLECEQNKNMQNPIGPYLTPHAKIIQNNLKTYVERYLHKLGFINYFLELKPKAQAGKKNAGFHNKKTFCSSKDTINRMKVQSINGKNIFANSLCVIRN